MFTVYKNTQIFYDIIGKGKTIVFLHGWGLNSNFFSYFVNNLSGKKIVIDFPPFGKSAELSEPFDLTDYANIVKQILTENSIQKFSVISHSFGTRVAIKLCKMYNDNVQKLVITGGAGLKPKNKTKVFFRKIKYKIKRFFNKNALVGSKDYQNLSPVMKKTFSNIINENLDEVASTINTKTLIIYGNLDKETPLYMAKKFNKLIQNSKLKIYKGYDHFAYLENKDEFLLDINIFLKE